jgi:bis(5'-nucleosyl)-tetraphosphatase (symmetrical)
MRWVVGDVQGCARELDELLARIRFDPARDELWCLGDLVNRGPDSLAALRLWRDVNGRSLIGNHDAYALLARSRRRLRKRDTLDELFASPECDALLARVREQPVLRRLAGLPGVDDVWIVHAGLDPRWGDLDAVARRVNSADHDDEWLESPDVAFATAVRCCTAAGARCRFAGLPEECPEGYEPWDRFYSGTVLVVHGHWARRGYYRGRRTLGLDSGCVYGGDLTAWCHEEDRIEQVPSRDRRSREVLDLGRGDGDRP